MLCVQRFFLLVPFNTGDSYCFESNLSLVLHIEVLLMKVYNVVLQSSKHDFPARIYFSVYLVFH